MTHDDIVLLNERVKLAADEMNLENNENLQHLDPDLLRVLGEYLAAEILFTVDMMKGPGVMHKVFKGN